MVVDGQNSLLPLFCSSDNISDESIDAANLIANDSSQIQADSQGLGNAGNITVTVEDTISLRDGSTFNTSINEDALGDAGNIFIRSDSLSLDNNATISTSTTFGEGGNITLQISNSLFLQNRGLISAEATDNADGGNINIDTNFIVAFPDGNNDIRAKELSLFSQRLKSPPHSSSIERL